MTVLDPNLYYLRITLLKLVLPLRIFRKKSPPSLTDLQLTDLRMAHQKYSSFGVKFHKTKYTCTYLYQVQIRTMPNIGLGYMER